METDTSSPELIKLRILLKNNRQDGSGKVLALRRLVSELNVQLRPIRHWGWEYIHQVNKGKITPSKNLRTAIDRLYAKKILVGVVDLQAVTVLAPAGYVQHNSVLRIYSRECVRLSCKTSFVPNSPAQIYCSTDCRKLARKSDWLLQEKKTS